MKTNIEHDFELSFDPKEVGGGSFTYFSLGKDQGSGISDILIRWEQGGFGLTVDGACEKAEALANEVVTRWNGYPALIAVAEGMAGALRGVVDIYDECSAAKIEEYETAKQALAAYEAWKLNIEGERL